MHHSYKSKPFKCHSEIYHKTVKQRNRATYLQNIIPPQKDLQFHSLGFHSWHSVYKNSFYPLFSLQQKWSPCWIAAVSAPTHPMRPSPPINHSLPCTQTHINAHAGAHMHRHTGSLITLICIHPQDGTCTVC